MILTDIVTYARQLIAERARARDKVHALDTQIDDLIEGMDLRQLADLEERAIADFYDGPEECTVKVAS